MMFLNLSYIICLPTAQLPTKISSFISSFSFGLFLNSFPYLLASPPYCIISINCLLCSINLKTYAGTCDRTLGSSYNKRLGNSCFYRTVTNLVPKYLWSIVRQMGSNVTTTGTRTRSRVFHNEPAKPLSYPARRYWILCPSNYSLTMYLLHFFLLPLWTVGEKG